MIYPFHFSGLFPLPRCSQHSRLTCALLQAPEIPTSHGGVTQNGLGKPREVDSPKKNWKSTRMGSGNQAKTLEILTKWETTRRRLRRPPRGRRFAPPPWRSCCLPFGKDFLRFGLISGAHPEAFPLSFFGLSTFLGFPNIGTPHANFLTHWPMPVMANVAGHGWHGRPWPAMANALRS